MNDTFDLLISVCLHLLPDVHPDDRLVPGGLVSLLHGVSLGIVRRPRDHPGPYGHHRPSLR